MGTTSAQSATLTRQSLDLGADYVLRSLNLLSEVFGGDIVRGAVFLAVLQASSQHLRNDASRPEGARVEDAARRPASLSAIARSLGLPVETTRRHVIRLAEDGFVTRTPAGGVVVLDANLDRPDLNRAAQANRVNLAAVYERLSRGGLMPHAASPSGQPDAAPSSPERKPDPIASVRRA